MYAMGLSMPFESRWARTAPIKCFEASDKMINGRVKSGVTNTGAFAKAAFSPLNPRCAASLPSHRCPTFVVLVR